MKKFMHPTVISVFNEILEYLPVIKRGTTQGSDPTAYSSARLEIGSFSIQANNFWGTEFQIFKECTQIGNYYMEREWTQNGYRDVLYQRCSKGTLKLCGCLLQELRRSYTKVVERDEIEDPMGSLSDYE